MLTHLTLAILAGLAEASPFRRWASPVVDLGYATYQGSYNETSNIQSFLGIKYGADTSGENRWRAPQPPVSMSELQYANVSGPSCPAGYGGQTNTYFNRTVLDGLLGPQYSEDCLFVNVYLPPGVVPGQSSVPVLVDIHGGGYLQGDVFAVPYAQNLVAYNGQFIYVDVSYRLGAFGFLAGQEIYKNGNLNAGLLDQQAALQWVHQYISKFGGDPNHVTIYGESAGAGSVLHQVIANNGATSPQLFVATIASSPFVPPEYHWDDYVIAAIYEEFVMQANCSGSNDTLACLRSQSYETLEFANYNTTAVAPNVPGGDFVYTPVVDGSFVADLPSVLLKQGKINGQYVWAEHNVDEGLIANGFAFVPQSIGDSYSAQAEWISAMWPHYSASLIEVIQGIYNADTFGTLQLATNLIYGEQVFGCPAVWLAEAFEENGYLSVYAIPPSTHASDLFVLYYGTGSGVSQAGVKDYFDIFTTYATNNTAVAAGVDWKPFLPSGKTYMNLNTTVDGSVDNTIVTLDQGYINRCAFWRSIAQITPQ